ncbi:MAG: hypothetical protein CM15mP86_05210 [Gammaproteobacteria bacterium]|nr:MAG: hypothetical protein CM15mP86_05210 [Gammaproteobacteria bacterium]
MFGLCAIILAEDGLVWNMRILSDNPLARKYGYSEDSSSKAPEKIAQAINLIDKQLLGQADKGSPYLIGDGITALDIYWATMSMAISPVSLNIMPATQQNQGMLKMFEIGFNFTSN